MPWSFPVLASSHSLCIKGLYPVLAGLLVCAGFYQVLEGVQMGQPVRIGGKVGMAAQVGQVQGVEQFMVDRVVAGGDGNRAVGRLEQAIRSHDAVVVSGSGRQVAACKIISRKGVRWGKSVCMRV